MSRPRLAHLMTMIVATVGLGARGSPCGDCPDAYVETKPVLLAGDAGDDTSDAADASFDATGWSSAAPTPAECDELCGTYPDSCRKVLIGDAQVPAVECTTHASCGAGRRTAGVVTPYAANQEARARWLAELATLEEVAIEAFVRLRAELRAHGAPRALLRRASKAAQDERRHARATRSLARRHGARLLPASMPPATLRDLETVAIENAVEGCVGETYGALMATVQAERARDADVRAAFDRIAREERRHAELALAIHDFACKRLGSAARRRVEDARARAAARLIDRLAPVAAPLAELGVPSRDEAQRLSRALFQSLGYLAADGTPRVGAKRGTTAAA